MGGGAHIREQGMAMIEVNVDLHSCHITTTPNFVAYTAIANLRRDKTAVDCSQTLCAYMYGQYCVG